MVFCTLARMLSSAWSSVWKNRPSSLMTERIAPLSSPITVSATCRR